MSHSDFKPFFGEPMSLGTNHDIFMVMPFRDDLKPVYEDHVLKVSQSLNLTCIRGDDFFSSESIIAEVWSAIYYADICIAECTGRNPNVFYEIGIAHTIGKPTILISQSVDDIPFDLRYLRTLIYDFTPKGMEDFEDKLTRTIQHYLPNRVSDNEYFADALNALMESKGLSADEVAQGIAKITGNTSSSGFRRMLTDMRFGKFLPKQDRLKQVTDAMALDANEKSRLLNAYLNGNPTSDDAT